jgi:hypothetical protein
MPSHADRARRHYEHADPRQEPPLTQPREVKRARSGPERRLRYRCTCSGVRRQPEGHLPQSSGAFPEPHDRGARRASCVGLPDYVAGLRIR